MGTITRSRGDVDLPPPYELDRLKLSPEVAWYLLSRGFPLPDCPPKWKTPEAGEVLKGARFDPGRVDRFIAAMELLRHTKGKWAGNPLRPDPWQVAYIIAPVMGWVRWESDERAWVRVVRELYVDVSRKAGKSTLCGAFGIYLTCADGEAGAEVLAAATTEKQAGYVFDPVKQLAQHSPALKPHVRAYMKKIVHPKSGSYFQVVSSVAEALHGANVHGAVIDELHVHESAELVETIETGVGSRSQPLIVIITTADSGRTGTIYARKRGRVEQLARRAVVHPQTYGVIWAAEETDDPFVEETWRGANPGYGVSPTRAYMRERAEEARQSPADLSKFLRLHLGIRTKQQTKYLELGPWDASAGMVDELDLKGLPCHGGLDLASVSDIAALCWDFPGPGDSHRVVWRFWLPADRLPDLSRRTAGEAEVWAREGFLHLTPGNVIDNDAIVTTIDRDAQQFDVRTLGFDRWGATDVVRRLMDGGLTCVPIGQGFASLSSPLKELLRLVLAGRYVHGGNPVARWMVDNLAVRMDPAGNVKPDKDKSGDKIDGVSAAVNALKECMDSAAKPADVWGFYA